MGENHNYLLVSPNDRGGSSTVRKGGSGGMHPQTNVIMIKKCILLHKRGVLTPLDPPLNAKHGHVECGAKEKQLLYACVCLLTTSGFLYHGQSRNYIYV